MANLSYEDVQKQVGARASEVWQAICTIGGYGQVPVTFDGGLSLSGLDAAQRAKVDALLGKQVVAKEAK